MFSQLGPLEIVLILVVVLLIFGPKRLPGLGRQLGGGLREFKDSITGDRKDHDEEGESQPALAAAPAEEPARASAEQAAPDAAREPRS